MVVLKQQGDATNKNDWMAAFNTAVGGRIKALRQDMAEKWSGKTGIEFVIGDYVDYLSLYNPAGDEDHVLDLREFFNATRAHDDLGNYEDYGVIMDKMGTGPDPMAYRKIRQQARNGALDKQNDRTGEYIDRLMYAAVAGGENAPNPIPVSITLLTNNR